VRQLAGPSFDWHPLVYVGDARSQSIVRRKSKTELEQIFCRDQRFDDMVCLEAKEVQIAVEKCQSIINQCKQW
jgi:hypothetical protein